MSRRRFLQALGAAGGAGAVLVSMEALGLAPNVLRHKQASRAPRSSDFHLRRVEPPVPTSSPTVPDVIASGRIQLQPDGLDVVDFGQPRPR